MNQDDIKNAREIIKNATHMGVFGRAALVGWPQALDEVERLQKDRSLAQMISDSQDRLDKCAAMLVDAEETAKLRTVAEAAEKYRELFGPRIHDLAERLDNALKAWRGEK